MVSHNLLNILVCPVCKGRLVSDEGIGMLRCSPCGLAFPVKEGIPVMLLDEAENIESRNSWGGTPPLDIRHHGEKVRDQ